MLTGKVGVAMFGKAQNILAAMTLLALTLLMVGCGDTAPVPKLETARAKAEACVEPTDVMRKNHMDFVLHQRDKTMHNGIRTTRHSLKACVNCHVPAEQNGKPVNYLTDDHDLNPDHFCATCHLYVGVKLDCFECHSDNPAGAAPVDSTHAALNTSLNTNNGGTTYE